jgi:hypothetical protein
LIYKENCLEIAKRNLCVVGISHFYICIHSFCFVVPKEITSNHNNAAQKYKKTRFFRVSYLRSQLSSVDGGDGRLADVTQRKWKVKGIL